MQIFVNKKLQSGFAMLEVMIAAFILGFSVLALAALQIKTFGLTRDASLRTDIAMQAESLAESMRANPVRYVDANGALQIKWDNYLANSANGGFAKPSQQCSGLLNNGINCSSAQVAKYDSYMFYKNLSASFPNTNDLLVQICQTNNFSIPKFSDMGCSGSGAMAIKIVWRTKASKAESKAVSSAKDGFIESGYVLRIGQ